jgi:cytosine/adenosine deaminase-related metal-dependent hydrolase
MVPDQDTLWTLTARWILPVDTAPLPGGTVSVAGDRIQAVQAHGQRRPDIDLGNVAVLPGFVNAHTHLDLTGLRGRCPPSPDFTGWLRQVIQHRRNVAPEQVQADIQTGIADCVRWGTTLVGDIAGSGASWAALTGAPVRAVVFDEILGLPQARVAPVTLAAHSWLLAHPPTSTCWPGLSPHAPYSVHRNLFKIAGGLCGNFKAPLAVHLGESAAEVELVRHRRGPFVPFLEELGVWEPAGLADNLRQVLRLCGRAPRVLLIHANHIRAPIAVPRRGTVVFCPRTHAAFGHPPHPFRQFQQRGVRVALGTDSLASNPDLSVLEEARYLHQRHPDVPPAQLLHMATLAGAEALGWQDETGSLRPGKSADLVVLPLPDEEPRDPHELVLSSQLPIRSVLFRGQWVVGRPESSFGP